mmetsp:Transcript_94136/g.245181  ORF Transcript_94136/g.245181 Transcript_94136/m.245181 type:complete len:310 (-) Transcript_94136:919-1848(-)
MSVAWPCGSWGASPAVCAGLRPRRPEAPAGPARAGHSAACALRAYDSTSAAAEFKSSSCSAGGGGSSLTGAASLSLLRRLVGQLWRGWYSICLQSSVAAAAPAREPARASRAAASSSVSAGPLQRLRRPTLSASAASSASAAALARIAAIVASSGDVARWYCRRRRATLCARASSSASTRQTSSASAEASAAGSAGTAGGSAGAAAALGGWREPRDRCLPWVVCGAGTCEADGQLARASWVSTTSRCPGMTWGDHRAGVWGALVRLSLGRRSVAFTSVQEQPTRLERQHHCLFRADHSRSVSCRPARQS